MRTLIGLVAFGNLPFTQLTINSIRATTKSPFEFFVVVGNPNDNFTPQWLDSQEINYMWHRDCNRGFPVCLNEIYDWAFPSASEHNPFGLTKDYDALIIAGNDIVPYPGAVDALIGVAATTDWEWCCSSQFDVRSLCDSYPEARQYFDGPAHLFDHFGQDGVESSPLVRPWELHQHEAERLLREWEQKLPGTESFIQADCIKDVRNLCLFKRSVFEKLGYADPNFWPGGYFEDNDYCRRARLAGVKACGVAHSAYFHFWSRTIHQGEGTSSRQFTRNSDFYRMKWGGPFDGEAYQLPFNGKPYRDPSNPDQPYVCCPGDLKIGSRDAEPAIVEYWRRKSPTVA